MCPAASSSKKKTKKTASKKTSKKATAKKSASSEVEPADTEIKRAGASSAQENSAQEKTPEQKTPIALDLKSTAKLLNKDPNYLTLKLSSALKSRLAYKAESEGLSISDFCEELLAEGIVLRAWEIMERKATLKQDNQGQGGNNRSHSYGNNHKGNNNHFKNNKNQGNNNRRSHNNNNRSKQAQNFNNKMMDDKATFMEYLRKQESK